MTVGAIAAEHVLRGRGLVWSAWAVPFSLDAATRAATVQLERAGDWDAWMRAWCALVAKQAAATERDILDLELRMSRERDEVIGQRRVGPTDAVVLGRLHSVSTFTIPDAVGATGLSAPTVGTSITRLEEAGLAIELTGQSRDRVWTSVALKEFTLAT